MDRRTTCLRQADAFREKALADPEHPTNGSTQPSCGWSEPGEAGCRVMCDLKSMGERAYVRRRRQARSARLPRKASEARNHALDQ